MKTQHDPIHQEDFAAALPWLIRLDSLCHWNACSWTIRGGDRGSTEYEIEVGSPAPAEEFCVRKWSTLSDAIRAAVERMEDPTRWPDRDKP